MSKKLIKVSEWTTNSFNLVIRFCQFKSAVQINNITKRARDTRLLPFLDVQIKTVISFEKKNIHINKDRTESRTGILMNAKGIENVDAEEENPYVFGTIKVYVTSRDLWCWRCYSQSIFPLQKYIPSIQSFIVNLNALPYPKCPPSLVPSLGNT